MNTVSEWKNPFIGKPKLREIRNGVKIWDQTMRPYPRELFHMGRLRFPVGRRWGSIEECAAKMLEEVGLSAALNFKSNIPWRYYQNHYREKPFDETVQAIESFRKSRKLSKSKLRDILAEHNFNGMPDLLGRNGRRFDLWEIKAPLDNHEFAKSRKILEDLADYGFNANLLCLHEFGKDKAVLFSERTRNLKIAQSAYADLLNSSAGKKVIECIVAPTLDGTLSENSVNYIFSKIDRGVSYFVYALVYFFERVNTPYEARHLKVFSLTQKEIIYLSRQLHLCGTYHWWRVPLLCMNIAADSFENEEYVELIRFATRWENTFRTQKSNRSLDVDFFLNFYQACVCYSQSSTEFNRTRERLSLMPHTDVWRSLYYSKPLR